MNNTVTNQIDVASIFEKVKTLSDDDKMLLRRAWKIPFNRLRMPQKALLFSIIGNDNVAIYKMDFLSDMMAIYIKQGCESGKPFECVLKTMYDAGNAAAKQKIGYMIDERDKRIFINYVTRYVELCSKENNIDEIKPKTAMHAHPVYSVRHLKMSCLTFRRGKCCYGKLVK